MKMEAFPWPSRYIDGSAKTINAASHHGIMQANERRAPARHPRISATRQQTDRQAKPNQNGSKRTQNLALAPSGWRKYPYVRPVCGTRRVKACLCQNQIVRITTTAARNGRNDFASWSKTRLSPIANPSRTTHQATKNERQRVSAVLFPNHHCARSRKDYDNKRGDSRESDCRPAGPGLRWRGVHRSLNLPPP